MTNENAKGVCGLGVHDLVMSVGILNSMVLSCIAGKMNQQEMEDAVMKLICNLQKIISRETSDGINLN